MQLFPCGHINIKKIAKFSEILLFNWDYDEFVKPKVDTIILALSRIYHHCSFLLSLPFKTPTYMDGSIDSCLITVQSQPDMFHYRLPMGHYWEIEACTVVDMFHGLRMDADHLPIILFQARLWLKCCLQVTNCWWISRNQLAGWEWTQRPFWRVFFQEWSADSSHVGQQDYAPRG